MTRPLLQGQRLQFGHGKVKGPVGRSIGIDGKPRRTLFGPYKRRGQYIGRHGQIHRMHGEQNPILRNGEIGFNEMTSQFQRQSVRGQTMLDRNVIRGASMGDDKHVTIAIAITAIAMEIRIEIDKIGLDVGAMTKSGRLGRNGRQF